MRRPEVPNPFDQRQPARLRIFLDQPVTTGPIDGQAEYASCPFIGTGSTGYPNAPAVLRSCLTHPALKVMRASDELHEEGDMVIGEPGPYDTLS